MKKDIFLKYVAAVTGLYNIDTSLFYSKSKTKDSSEARYMVYYLCMKRGITAAHIQAYMTDGGYNPRHTPIHRGLRKITARVAEDKDYATIVSRIENSVFI
jgi:chromosomal replication initiation ATPase DnaA